VDTPHRPTPRGGRRGRCNREVLHGPVGAAASKRTSADLLSDEADMAGMPDVLGDHRPVPDNAAVLRSLGEISRPLNGGLSVAEVLSQMQRHNNSYRKLLRARFRRGVVVGVRCRRCRRVLGECYGSDATALSAIWGPDGVTAPLLHPRGPVVRWRCRCGASGPIRGADLAAAFPTAGTQPNKNDQVIWLPFATPSIRSGSAVRRP
jgi:hypothetical protein